MHYWDILELEPTTDVRLIKKAYSVKLKSTRPDDDPQAYQELREAYDWAIQQSKFLSLLQQEGAAPTPLPDAEPSPEHVPATPASPAAEEVAAPPTDNPVQVLEALLQHCARTLEINGSQAFLHEWPGIEKQLHDLPIGFQVHASRAFARFILEQDTLPHSAVVALTRHFRWGMDFRADEYLGTELSLMLHHHLTSLHVYETIHAKPDTKNAWLIRLASLWAGKHSWLGHFATVLLDMPARQKAFQLPKAKLQAQGLTDLGFAAYQSAIKRGFWIQLLLLLVLLFFGAQGVHALLDSTPKTTDDFFLDCVIVIFLLAYTGLYKYTEGLNPLWPWLRARLHAHNALTLLPWLIVSGYAIYLGLGHTAPPEAPVAAGLVYLFLWFLMPTDEMPWRRFVLPVYLIETMCIETLFPNEDPTIRMSVVTGLVLGTDALMRFKPTWPDSWYQSLVNSAPPYRAILVITMIRGIISFLPIVGLLFMPIYLFRWVANRPISAYATILAGLWCIQVTGEHPRFDLLPIFILLAGLAMLVFEHALQKLVERLFRP